MADPIVSNSFIENINTVANASKLATGDVVEDAQLARDQAVAAATNAKASEEASLGSEGLSRDWANKGHNNPVTGEGTAYPEYSSYHWSVEASNAIGDPLINDNILSSNYTWSSTKIDTELSGKALMVHNHDTVYEPKITIHGNAFNKNYGGSSGEYGTADNIARTDHMHDSRYMPLAVKNSAYNKDFGTTSGTVSDGAHKHDSEYMAKVVENTAYNKSFVVNVDAPLETEVPRGNHLHKAVGITYDNTNNLVVSSSTAQGAIGQLDARVGSISVAEKCKLNAGMTNANYNVPISAVNTPSEIITAMTVSPSSKNALFSAGRLIINYDTDPDKLVEGWFSVTVTIDGTSGYDYALSVAVNGNIIDTSFRAIMSNDSTGGLELSLTGFISGLFNGDGLSAVLINLTDDTDIPILGHTVSFAGEPEGALVLSGATVEHSDILGRDVAGQHPTTSIYDSGSSVALDVILDGKMDKVSDVATITDNLVAMDSGGNSKDSGISIADVHNKADMLGTPILDNILTMEIDGSLKDGGKKINDLALLGGNNAQKFKVADGSAVDDATSLGQMNATLVDYVTDVDFQSHTGAVNPHGTGYADVGAAASAHTHAEADVVGLTDKLNERYVKTSLPITNNVPVYSSANELIDSGVSIQGKLLTGEAI